MKRALLFLLAVATATALVAPKLPAVDQTVIANNNNNDAPSGLEWWDSIIQSSGFQALTDSFEHAIKDTEAALSRAHPKDNDDDEGDDDDGHHHHGGKGKHGHHGHHGDVTKTIWELISTNKHTTRFAALVEEHDDIKDLLSDTSINHTLFIPTDRAFDRIPDHGKDKKPPPEVIRAILLYHLAPGRFCSRRLYYSHTIPSALNSSSLGDHPQRLRISSHLFFNTKINFFAKVIMKDIHAKNGLIHAVDSILLPPPPTAKIIQLLPNAFSTLSLALETTGLGEELKDLTFHGGTFFAPTNKAFTRLGPRANAFLFSDRGKKYLKALVKYSIVANETLYSDAFYRPKEGDEDDAEKGVSGKGRDYWHVDLPSLLDDKPISVDVRSWKGWTSIVANGFTRVLVQDGLARDGVIQVVGSVLFPPHKDGHSGVEEEEEREWEEEEIVQRLEEYVEEGEEDMRDL